MTPPHPVIIIVELTVGLIFNGFIISLVAISGMPELLQFFLFITLAVADGFGLKYFMDSQ
jgi:hypothetical protein